FFPAQGDVIDEASEKVKRVVVSQRGGQHRALTINNGPSSYPTVIYRWLGEPSDLMVVAHEFAHALQILTSKEKFVTPIMREVCAFTGEIALLLSMSGTNSLEYQNLSYVWRKDNEKYLELDGKTLRSALYKMNSVYSYSWNYPIARVMAIAISLTSSR